MADKRHTIRHELPAGDVQPLQTPGAASITTWDIDDAEKPGNPTNTGYQEEHVHELTGSSVEVGGMS